MSTLEQRYHLEAFSYCNCSSPLIVHVLLKLHYDVRYGSVGAFKNPCFDCTWFWIWNSSGQVVSKEEAIPLPPLPK